MITLIQTAALGAVLSSCTPIQPGEMFKVKSFKPIVERFAQKIKPTPKGIENPKKWVKTRARITYYTPYEDKWGSQTADPKTKRAKEGVTVAAHPDFKFGTEVQIPGLNNHVGDGKFLVQDRGGAVKSKKAAKGKRCNDGKLLYVFDVFVSSTAKMKVHMRKRDMWMDVYIKRN